MLIIGTRFFAWGSDLTSTSMRCAQCGALARFVMKKGMRFITLFFVIPVMPISGVKRLTQCPNCGARYQAAA